MSESIDKIKYETEDEMRARIEAEVRAKIEAEVKAKIDAVCGHGGWKTVRKTVRKVS